MLWWTNPNVWTFRFGNFQLICEHLPFLPWHKQILRLLLVHRTPGSLDMISMTFAAIICDADDPCSVNTA